MHQNDYDEFFLQISHKMFKDSFNNSYFDLILFFNINNYLYSSETDVMNLFLSEEIRFSFFRIRFFLILNLFHFSC